MTLRDVTLEDRFRLDSGPVLLSGAQALVRMLLTQRELDRRAGLNTGGYVSGYRGSPLGGVDTALWAAARPLQAAGIHFVPGVNEDLAATAVWGTQQLRVAGETTVDGVFGMWYGKGPGVDRSGDPIKHGNYAGTHPNGGVLAVFGDDHPGKSSTIAHHSEQAMAANSVPVLYPSDVTEFVRFGVLGWAMSRYSGCWVGMKLVNETVEQTATCDFDLDTFAAVRPDAADLMPAEGVHYRAAFAPLQDEITLMRARLPLVRRFARANGIDRVSRGDGGRFGLVTAGKAHQDTLQALGYLGIDETRARALGIAVYKVGMIWPVEPEGLRGFAVGRDELMFVEEKAAFMEPQAAALLYNDAVRPRITGKRDDAGEALLPEEVQLEPVDVALAIARRLKALGIWDEALAARSDATRAYRGALLDVVGTGARRLPFFCSGCPHNTSTNVPSGSVAISGIGCHGMAIWAKPGTTLPGPQMGGEGMNWVGLANFTKRKHVFQNLGDGTYFHSGLLAIRAAVAADVNITYKILFNDAVAMTGGQPVDGPITPVRIVHQVLHEGARRVVLVTDDPARYDRGAGLPDGVRVEHRDRLDAVQRELREIEGVTAIVYEQTCAAEKRRRRKRGSFPDPDKRLFIYEDVCEGCGDCSDQSGCTSIEPVETPLGRKRRINQSSCNKDYSCVKGFCPSFVTVEGGRLKTPPAVPDAELPPIPAPAVAALGPSSFNLMIAGIGGTGVITVGAVLAMAAHLESKAASVYDMTGLSQKNGGVYSHLRIAPDASAIHSQRIGLGEASLTLAFDMLAAMGDESFRTLDPAAGCFVGNDRVQPGAAINFDRNANVDTTLLQRKVAEKIAVDRTAYVDATGLATALCGDAMATNLFLVGVAAQRGWLPVTVEAILRAIELNGVQVAMNRRAFGLGRLWVHDADACLRLAGDRAPKPAQPVQVSLDALIADRTARLTAWQDAGWAQRFRATIEAVRAAEARVAPGSERVTRAAAAGLAKLMSYKDEYEVARLYASPAFRDTLAREFEGAAKLSLNLAPPLLSGKLDDRTGRPAKRTFGPWILPALGWLARFKSLRGTALDPFGRTEERRMERRLIETFIEDLGRLAGAMAVSNLDAAAAVANWPDEVRGFGPVKQANADKALALREAAWSAMSGQPQVPSLTRQRSAA